MTNPNWPSQRLGDLFDIGAGKTMSAAARAGNDKVPFLRTSNVLWDEVDLTTLDEMSIPPDELGEKRLKAGDLLVCEGGDIGRAAVWDGRIPTMSFQNHLHRLRPAREDVEPRFYVYFLQCAFTQLGIFEGAGNKTTIPNLSRNRLASLEVPYPPLPEQRALVRALATVRSAIATQGRATAAAEELKRATMRELFTRGLRDASLIESEFGQIPGTWLVVPLEKCATVQTGIAKGRLVSPADAVEVPYLRVANVQDGYLDLSQIKTIAIARSELDRYRLLPGDVLLTEGGDFDKLGRGHMWRGQIDPCVHQNHVFAVRTDQTLLLPEYLAYLAQSHYGRGYFLKVAHKTTNLACINTTKLKALPVPLPPKLEEQREIVAILGAIDHKIDLHRHKRQVLEELFKALLHKLMTGEIRVQDLDLSALDRPVAA
ncbi:MAG: restriction endonuclease subunit S [Chromatiales bacterium]|nr:restriction endonuclease subunit S [Chromatiales bacterium]